MRRLILLGALLACAQPGIPPGGPPDVAPPRLLRVRPDSNAVNVRANSITFEFDEVISERPQSGSSLADVVQISPSKGASSVSWRRSRLSVTPNGGLLPNTTYTVVLRPGVTDLAGNVDSVGRSLAFATGPRLATASVRGVVFDWVAGKVAPRAYVEAISLPDSARYATSADSLGQFQLSHLSSGRFLLRAIVDQNGNRQLDARELFDSSTVTLQDSLRREFLTIVRDSLGPGIANADGRDSLSLRVTFDRAVDTAFILVPSRFTLKAADSSAVSIRSVLRSIDLERRAADSARAKQVEDSVRRVFIADSVRRVDSLRAAAAPRPAATGRRPGAQTAPPPAPRAALPKEAPPPPKNEVPTTAVILFLERPLRPGTTYRLHADSLRSVTGAVRSSDRTFTTARPAAKPESSGIRPRAPND